MGTPASVPDAKRTHRWTAVFLKWLFLSLGTIILLFVVYTWTMLNWSYSRGERAGYIQKFSKKGWISKTWEGELTMVTIPGTMTEKFIFTVRDDSVASRINALMGRRVTLTYEQHVGVPTNLFGETEYFVTSISSIE
jgi:hypothetical protein